MQAGGQVQTDADKILALMRSRLGVRARDLPRAVKRAARSLPRHHRRQAWRLAEAVPLAEHPKLALTLDNARLRTAASEVISWLESIDGRKRRRIALINLAADVVFKMLLVAAGVGAILVWRGLV